ncbi:uncharacterized protein LOC107981092 [Nasonia vitripennis]|uniref:Uncharacterized protein n=1 Tax=Nasonia vitripennis TaxID=7425 RepID=A0A7M7QK98_NASVI|nr:uncharacterized protein LOC107981092 [Nasonia vitripennis]
MTEPTYIVLLGVESGDCHYSVEYISTDPYDVERVRTLDRQLHRCLIEIIQERGISTGQLRQHLSKDDSIIEDISRRQPDLGKLLMNRFDLPLLWVAVLCRYQESAELLVRYGADVEETCDMQRSMHGVRVNKKLSILHALVEMYPSEWNERFMALVIEHDADLEIRDCYGRSVLHLAVLYCRVELIEKLLQLGVDVQTFCDNGKTPLLEAADNEKAELLMPLLVRYGASLNDRDPFGFNVLYYLASAPGGQHLDLARDLIKFGISPREITTNSEHDQTIHVAVRHDKIDLVNFYLDNGASVNASGFYGEGPLSVAVKNCEGPEMMLNLLRRGADIDQKNLDGETASHSLAKTDKNMIKKMDILLAVGADMFAENQRGMSAFDIIHRRINPMEAQSMKMILKRLSLCKSRLQPNTELKNERFYKRLKPNHWSYCQTFLEEIKRMRSTKFIETCSFYDLLTKCHCKIAQLMRHLEFEKKFREFDHSVFELYSEDIVEAFERAKKFYDALMDQEELIAEVTNNILPDMVVRKLADYTVCCEIDEIKMIVQASRSGVHSKCKVENQEVNKLKPTFFSL